MWALSILLGILIIAFLLITGESIDNVVTLDPKNWKTLTTFQRLSIIWGNIVLIVAIFVAIGLLIGISSYAIHYGLTH